MDADDYVTVLFAAGIGVMWIMEKQYGWFKTKKERPVDTADRVREVHQPDEDIPPHLRKRDGDGRP